MKNIISFSKSFIKNKKTIGSLIPSSRNIGKHIIKRFNKKKFKHILEIGGGTGAITSELVSGLEYDKLTVIEMDPDLFNILKNNEAYTNINIIQGDFFKVRFQSKFDCIVSSLPLSNFNQDENNTFTSKIVSLLDDDGQFCFFEYIGLSPVKIKKLDTKSLDCQGRSLVKINIPPASIKFFKKNSIKQ